MTRSHFYDYLPFEEYLALYLNKLEFPSPKDTLYQVWLNLACWFLRRRFLKIFNVFLLFCYYLPLEKGYSLCLNTFESPSPRWFVPILFKIGQVVLEKIFKLPNPIFTFLWLSPLWTGTDPLSEQFRIPFTQGWFVPRGIEIGLLVLEEKIFSPI